MLQLNEAEVQYLEKILEYVIDTEADNYEQYCLEGETPEKHIYFHAYALQVILSLKKELPPVNLTGDTSLKKFIKG